MSGSSLTRRQVLSSLGLSGLGAVLIQACSRTQTSSEYLSKDSAPEPRHNSSRARLKNTSTLDRTAMYLYNVGGIVGQDYSVKQIETVAKVYDLLTWVYANSKIPEIAHRANPQVIVTQYFDLTWVGSYDQAPNQPWMPVPWDYVNAHENFFAHSSLQTSPSTRIANPIFGYGPNNKPTMKQDDPSGAPHEWLANPYDFDPYNPASMDHWINYFANSSAAIIKKAGMDGIMMDEVELPYGASPYGYTSQSWYSQLDKSLSFIRDRLGPDKVMFANGVFGDSIPALLNPSGGYPNGPTWPSNDMKFLTWCDGLQMELFVTSYAGPQIWPQLFWEGVCQVCMDIAASNGVTLAQAPILAENQSVRMFVLASFHLVKAKHSYLSHRGGDSFPWFPEWTISLGSPTATQKDIQDYLVPLAGNDQIISCQGVCYARPFSNGLALVNPSSNPSSVDLSSEGYLLDPKGGGWITSNGRIPKGTVEYSSTKSVELPPQSGALVVWHPRKYISPDAR